MAPPRAASPSASHAASATSQQQGGGDPSPAPAASSAAEPAQQQQQQQSPSGRGGAESSASAEDQGGDDPNECGWCRWMKGGGCKAEFEARAAGAARAHCKGAHRDPSAPRLPEAHDDERTPRLCLHTRAGVAQVRGRHPGRRARGRRDVLLRGAPARSAPHWPWRGHSSEQSRDPCSFLHTCPPHARRWGPCGSACSATATTTPCS